MFANNGVPHPRLNDDALVEYSGVLDVKFNSGAFSPWTNLLVRLEGRWVAMYKKDGDVARTAAIELGPGVNVTDLNDAESATKFPRRFDVHCSGGQLASTEYIFRTKSRKDRDKWVVALTTNIRLLNGIGLDPLFGISDLELVLHRMQDGVALTPIRIRSSLVVRCASGEDMVTFLVATGLAKDRSHAVDTCRRLLGYNAIHHVVWEKDFADAPEHYAISALEQDATYNLEHFQKYMDSRRFWKYFDEDDGLAGTQGARSTSSGESASLSARMSQSTGNGSDPWRDVMVNGATPAAIAAAEKKAKKCAVCGKSFNPLRRRYCCHVCKAWICSHCSISRRADGGENSVRICTTCKLGEMSGGQEFFDRVFSSSSLDGSERGMARSNSFSQGSSTVATSASNATTMTAEKRFGSANNLVTSGPQRKISSASQGSTPSSRNESFSSTSLGPDCPLCMNDVCAPLRDVYELSYPVLDPSDKDEYLTAEMLEKEPERLKYVKALLRAMERRSLAASIKQMCSMAAIATACPMVIVGMLDANDYVICGQHGVKSPQAIIRSVSLASHTCRKGAPLVCSDLNHDIRFNGNPWRRETLRAAFYAGIPIRLANGSIVGAVEVFDFVPRARCVEILNQMQTIVRSVQRKLDETLQAMKSSDPRANPRSDRINNGSHVASSSSDRRKTHDRSSEDGSPIDIVEVKPANATVQHATPHHASASPRVAAPSRTPKSLPPAPLKKAASTPKPKAVTVPKPAPAPAAATPNSAAASAAAPAAAAADNKMSQNEMETKLLQLLSQTTDTQEQLKNQQGQMVMAISTHSQQISQLAKQLERMENTLASKLDAQDSPSSPLPT